MCRFQTLMIGKVKYLCVTALALTQQRIKPSPDHQTLHHASMPAVLYFLGSKGQWSRSHKVTKCQNQFWRAVTLLAGVSPPAWICIANECISSLRPSLNIGLAVLCFYSKQVFGPRTAKSQPIWIKFCTHLLLYGIHLWADFDRDRRVGGSRTNQTSMFFVILAWCNAP